MNIVKTNLLILALGSSLVVGNVKAEVLKTEKLVHFLQAEYKNAKEKLNNRYQLLANGKIDELGLAVMASLEPAEKQIELVELAADAAIDQLKASIQKIESGKKEMIEKIKKEALKKQQLEQEKKQEQAPKQEVVAS